MRGKKPQLQLDEDTEDENQEDHPQSKEEPTDSEIKDEGDEVDDVEEDEEDAEQAEQDNPVPTIREQDKYTEQMNKRGVIYISRVTALGYAS